MFLLWNLKNNLRLTKVDAGETGSLASYSHIPYNVVKKNNKNKEKPFKDIKHTCSIFFYIFVRVGKFIENTAWGNMGIKYPKKTLLL